MAKWVMTLKPGQPVYADYKVPESSEGMGITDAPRGALGHWIKIKGHKIDNYQAIVPTTWNGGPRDDKGQPGPFEQALEGTKVKDEKNPFELVRIIRSFDPCLACAIHVVNPKGTEMGRIPLTWGVATRRYAVSCSTLLSRLPAFGIFVACVAVFG